MNREYAKRKEKVGMKKLFCDGESDYPLLLFVDNESRAVIITGNDFQKHYGEPLTREAAAKRDFQKIMKYETAAEAACANYIDYRYIFFSRDEYDSIEEL